MRDTPITKNEKDFILASLKSNLRIDGRELFDYRAIDIKFGDEDGTVEVSLGDTRVLAFVRGEVQAPRSDRPSEGFFIFNTEFSPMASIEYEGNRSTPEQIEMSRIIERTLKQTRAVDSESLCIVAGEQVWCIRCTIQIIDAGGNVLDCASIAMITALFHFRRNEVTVVGNEVTIHPKNERPPVPLAVHHIPICITFAFFEDTDTFLIDPSYKEEQAMESSMVIAMNAQSEICCLQKMGGTQMAFNTIMQCTRIATIKAKEITLLVRKALDESHLRRIGKQKLIEDSLNNFALFRKSQRDAGAFGNLSDDEDDNKTSSSSSSSSSDRYFAKKGLNDDEDSDNEDDGQKESKATEDDDQPMKIVTGKVQSAVPVDEDVKDPSLFTGGRSAWGDDDSSSDDSSETLVPEHRDAGVQRLKAMEISEGGDDDDEEDSEEEEVVILSETAAPAAAAAAPSVSTPSSKSAAAKRRNRRKLQSKGAGGKD